VVRELVLSCGCFWHTAVVASGARVSVELWVFVANNSSVGCARCASDWRSVGASGTQLGLRVERELVLSCGCFWHTAVVARDARVMLRFGCLWHTAVVGRGARVSVEPWVLLAHSCGCPWSAS
jgi:hypothetical protein